MTTTKTTKTQKMTLPRAMGPGGRSVFKRREVGEGHQLQFNQQQQNQKWLISTNTLPSARRSLSALWPSSACACPPWPRLSLCFPCRSPTSTSSRSARKCKTKWTSAKCAPATCGARSPVPRPTPRCRTTAVTSVRQAPAVAAECRPRARPDPLAHRDNPAETDNPEAQDSPEHQARQLLARTHQAADACRNVRPPSPDSPARPDPPDPRDRTANPDSRHRPRLLAAPDHRDPLDPTDSPATPESLANPASPANSPRARPSSDRLAHQDPLANPDSPARTDSPASLETPARKDTLATAEAPANPATPEATASKDSPEHRERPANATTAHRPAPPPATECDQSTIDNWRRTTTDDPRGCCPFMGLQTPSDCFFGETVNFGGKVEIKVRLLFQQIG
ncbi:hypothetical protein niasHS_001473 [Heterodera schachtii]|uniref:Uncharacterized protein n=1 Tax=Heterodera schachtii TaxID=97005 RepID=A0ABD2KDJ1_HETSC